MKAVDVMGFAGSFAVGVSQAGFDVIAKREPDAFGGFGAAAFEVNMPQVQVEVTGPEFWSIVKADYLYGCPPCSGFSMLSTNNSAESKRGPVDEAGVRHSLRGVDSPVNIWMRRLVEYAAKVKPEVAVFESVPSGGKMGAPLMRELWQLLRNETGMDYHFTDVFMNAASVGGNVIRPRYFWVAHTRPFGVDLPKAVPLPMKDVIGDLLEHDGTRLTKGIDTDWGHVTGGSPTGDRITETIETFRSKGYDWAQGKRLPEHLDYWVNTMGEEVPACWYKSNGEIYSHAVSDNMYSPFRWRWEGVMGVVAGGFMERAVHPIAARNFTYREGARFMGLPDTWSLRPIVEGNNGPWLGKAIPVSSGRFISTAARNSIDGTPGEYAGILVEPKHRVIDVTTPQKVTAIERDYETSPDWWPDRPRRIFSYETIGKTGRPASWTRADRARITPVTTPVETPVVAPVRIPTHRVVRPEPLDIEYTEPIQIRMIHRKNGRQTGLTRKVESSVLTAPSKPAFVRTTPTHRTQKSSEIIRVDPEVVQGFLDRLGLTRAQAADALGYSPSRIAEMTSHSRPKSWLNAEKWPELQEKLLAYNACVV